jgi:site-specific recombinase XerD
MDCDADQAAPSPYLPHSLRATSASLLLGAGVDIRKVQQLLGHRHITTTQIYDKRRRAANPRHVFPATVTDSDLKDI